MNKRWSVTKRVFSRARLLQGTERDDYLHRAQLDEATRQEVDSLLVQYDKSEHFLGLHSSFTSKVLSHFDIKERLGEGGMGLVYKAFDRQLKRWVALKVLPPWAMGHADSRERLWQEAQSVSALSHPNIVTVHALAEENGVHFIVMEFLSGRTLNQVIPPDGLPTSEALRYADQIADGLSAAHAAGVLHGDLKPLNVMVTDSGQLKLLDFGLARALPGKRHPQSRSSDRYGTKTYMAPELLSRRQTHPNERSEIFSLGLVLHEMLSGAHAFGPVSRPDIIQAIQNEPPKPLPAGVPLPVAEIVFRCLEKKARLRFSSVNEALSAIRSESATAAPQGLPIEHPNGSAGQTGAQRSTRREPARQAREQALLHRVGYENLAQSRQALAELERLMENDPSQALRDTLSLGLRDLLLSMPSDGHVILASIRDLRKRAFDLLRRAVSNDLRRCFERTDFEHLDLYGIDFSAARLGGMSFSGSFLVESDFTDSDLTGAFFTDARIRNVNFSKANLADADFTDADWFNSLALMPGQIDAVRHETLLDSPSDVSAMHTYLKNHYVVPFEAWPSHVQAQLNTAWTAYLRPGGLGSIIARWRRPTG
jgi:hypothetical protein